MGRLPGAARQASLSCGTVIALSLALALALPCPAAAGNRNSYPSGNDSALTGGAVTATVEDAGSLWSNPAGLGKNERRRLNVSLNAFVLRYRKLDDGIETGLSGVEDNSLSSADFLTVPSAGVVVLRLRPGISIGLGSMVETQDSYRIRTTIDGHVPVSGEPVTELIDVMSAERTVLMGGGMGFEPTPRFRFGFGLFAVYESRDRTGTLAVSIVDNDPDADSPSEASLLRTGESTWSRLGVDASIGVQVAPVAGLRIGLSVHVPRLMFGRFGDGFSVRTETLSTEAGSSSDFTLALAPDAELETIIARMPTATLGLAWQGKRWSLGLDGALTPPLSREDGELYRQLLWNIRLGLRFELSDRLELGAGLFTDRTDLPKPERFWEVRADFYGATVGARFRTPVPLASDQRADKIVLVSTMALRYALGIGQAGRMATTISGFDDFELAVGPAGQGSLRVHEIAVHLGSSLLF